MKTRQNNGFSLQSKSKSYEKIKFADYYPPQIINAWCINDQHWIKFCKAHKKHSQVDEYRDEKSLNNTPL